MRRDDHRAATGKQQECGVFLTCRLIGVERDIARIEGAARPQRACETVRHGRPDRDLWRLAEDGVRDDGRPGDKCDEQQTTRYAEAEQRLVEHRREAPPEWNVHAIARRRRQRVH